MKSFTTQLFVLACSFSALALHVRSESIPGTLANACPSVQSISSSSINVDGHDIIRQVFACPDGNFTTTSMSADRMIPASAFGARPALEARNQAECTTPAAECQCGASVICGCYDESVGPSSSDCSTLIGSTAVISSIEGPTIIIPPATVHTITLNTCALSFINLGNTNEEYCWDDLASIATGEISCMQSPPFSDAVCMAASQRFEIHLGAAVQ